MSAKTPDWLPPVAFVAILAVALKISNQPPLSPLGGTAISSDDEYHAAETKADAMSKDLAAKYDRGGTPTEAERAKLREAVTLYDKMSAFTPAISPLFFASAKIHHILGEDDIAEEKYRQCMLTFYNDAAARPQFAKGIRITGAEASYRLATMLVKEPNKQSAFEASDVAICYIKTSSAYYNVRAEALIGLGNVKAARADLEEAIRLVPSNPEPRRLLETLSK